MIGLLCLNGSKCIMYCIRKERKVFESFQREANTTKDKKMKDDLILLKQEVTKGACIMCAHCIIHVHVLLVNCALLLNLN